MLEVDVGTTTLPSVAVLGGLLVPSTPVGRLVDAEVPVLHTGVGELVIRTFDIFSGDMNVVGVVFAGGNVPLDENPPDVPKLLGVDELPEGFVAPLMDVLAPGTLIEDVEGGEGEELMTATGTATTATVPVDPGVAVPVKVIGVLTTVGVVVTIGVLTNEGVGLEVLVDGAEVVEGSGVVGVVNPGEAAPELGVGAAEGADAHRSVSLLQVYPGAQTQESTPWGMCTLFDTCVQSITQFGGVQTNSTIQLQPPLGLVPIAFRTVEQLVLAGAGEAGAGVGVTNPLGGAHAVPFQAKPMKQLQASVPLGPIAFGSVTQSTAATVRVGNAKSNSGTSKNDNFIGDEN